MLNIGLNCNNSCENIDFSVSNGSIIFLLVRLVIAKHLSTINLGVYHSSLKTFPVKLFFSIVITHFSSPFVNFLFLQTLFVSVKPSNKKYDVLK